MVLAVYSLTPFFLLSAFFFCNFSACFLASSSAAFFASASSSGAGSESGISGGSLEGGTTLTSGIMVFLTLVFSFFTF